MHQGQIDGGVIMGLGYALMEQLEFENGKVITTNFGDYKIPSALDIPPLKTVIVEESIGPGPYRSMSIGELPNVPVAAAIANAVHDAVNIRIKALPMSAERTYKALKGYLQ
jgi:CO/xanthine dehydrogenase Mo-binding subunit